MKFTVYAAGEDQEHALTGFLFDGADNALEYASDNGYNVYSVEATLDIDTMTLEWESEVEPTCDECGVHCEEADEWCGNCGMCKEHCHDWSGCDD